ARSTASSRSRPTQCGGLIGHMEHDYAGTPETVKEFNGHYWWSCTPTPCVAATRAISWAKKMPLGIPDRDTVWSQSFPSWRTSIRVIGAQSSPLSCWNVTEVISLQ